MSPPTPLGRASTLTLLPLLMLAACSAATPTAVARPYTPTAIAPLTISFWHTQSGAPGALLATLIDDFNAAHPTIHVVGEHKADEVDLMKQGLACIALDQAPDLVMASPRTIAEFARTDALVNLDTILDDPLLGWNSGERNDWVPGILDTGRFPDLKNQLLAVPLDAPAVVLYSNSDLLKSAKIKAPLQTWDQFNSAARATTQGNVRGWVMASNAAVFYAFLYSRGGSVLAMQGSQTQAHFNDDTGLKSLQMIAALSKGGSAYLVDSQKDALNDFSLGKSAFFFGTTADVTSISEAITHTKTRFQWSVSNIPQITPGHPATQMAGASLALIKTSDERSHAAWLFTRWLVAAEQMARWSLVTNTWPVRMSARALLPTNLPAPLKQLHDGLSNVNPAGRPLPTVKDAVQIDVAVEEMWTSVVNGTDPTAAMNRAASRVNRLLGQTP